MSTRVLSETRKADREAMALAIIALCERTTAVTCIRDESGFDSHFKRISLSITAAQGCSVGIEFEQESGQPNVYVLTWNTPIVRDRSTIGLCFARGFSQGRPNECHRGKSTCIAYGFRELVEWLEHDFAQLADGSAFDPEFAAEYDRKTAAGEHLWQRIIKAQQAGEMGGLLA